MAFLHTKTGELAFLHKGPWKGNWLFLHNGTCKRNWLFNTKEHERGAGLFLSTQTIKGELAFLHKWTWMGNWPSFVFTQWNMQEELAFVFLHQRTWMGNWLFYTKEHARSISFFTQKSLKGELAFFFTQRTMKRELAFLHKGTLKGHEVPMLQKGTSYWPSCSPSALNWP